LSLKRLTKESLIYGLSRYISKFISVFLLPLYTAVLKPEDYGILDLLSTIIIVSTFLIVSGTDSAVGYFYFRKENVDDRPVIITSSIILRLCIASFSFAIIYFASPFLSNLLFGRDLSLFVKITALTIFFQSLYSFLFDLLRLEFRAWLFMIVSTGSILSNILLTALYVLVLKQGVYGALIAQAISFGMTFVFTIVYVYKRYGFGFSKVWIKKILGYGFPLIGTGIAVWVLNSTDRYFLAHFQDLTAVGIYAVGAKVSNILGMVGGAIQNAWGPYALDIQYQSDAKKIYSKVFLAYIIINIIGIFLISMFAIDILKVFTRPNYYSAKAVIPFLCLSVVLSNGYFIASIGINITKKLQHTIWITITGATINILLNFLLTPNIGAVGAAFSIMTANFLILTLTIIISQKAYPIPYQYSKILLLFIPACMIIAVCYFFDLRLFFRIPLAILYSAFAAIYLYKNFKDSYELKKAIEYIKNFRLRKQKTDKTI
jgi:O-antigen/teichoic acid export membrane protein